ncbi:MAG: ATP-binding protein, partial [Planctomycetota bacterium]
SLKTSHGAERETLLSECTEKEGERKSVLAQLEEVRGTFQTLEERKRFIDEEIRPHLVNLEKVRERAAVQEQRKRVMAPAGWTVLGLFALSLIVAGVRPTAPFIGMSAVLLLLSVGWLVLRFLGASKTGGEEGELQKVRSSLTRFSLPADTWEAILAGIQQIDEAYAREGEKKQRLEGEAKSLGDRIDRLKSQAIPQKDRAVAEAEEVVGKIKKASKTETLDAYSGGLAEREEAERAKQEQEVILANVLTAPKTLPEETRKAWKAEIARLESFREKARGVAFDQEESLRLKRDRLEPAEKALRDIRERMEAFRNALADVERRANEILQAEEEFHHCKTTMDLDAVERALTARVDRLEMEMEDAREAMRIFEALEDEEKTKVSQLFGREAVVSDRFREITDGLYEEVAFSEGIEVTRRDGAVLDPHQLSGGAFDQLYFAIRLALGEQRLGGEAGFFLLDDPFIKADPDRLQRQLAMLLRIAASGWQVLYFSAKGEVKASLKDAIARGDVQFVEMEGLDF